MRKHPRSNRDTRVIRIFRTILSTSMLNRNKFLFCFSICHTRDHPQISINPLFDDRSIDQDSIAQSASNRNRKGIEDFEIKILSSSRD